MTKEEFRNIPVGGKVWYANVTMCRPPGIQLYVNDRPRAITKTGDASNVHNTLAFFATDLPRKNRVIVYEFCKENLFFDEKSALEYYCNEIQKATKEIAKRKREYCRNANAYAKKIQDGAIKLMNDFYEEI